jgi:RNA polymerase sigma-70 factor (ECF subfamily)
MRVMQNEAFEQAVHAHKDRVHSYAVMMLRDVEEARDVAQEALVRLWNNRNKVDPDGTRPWLLRTTHNLCIDRIRKRKVRGEVDGETLIPLQPDAAPGPGRLAESDQLGEVIRDALSVLSANDRAVVVMREIQSMPYDEIAEALQLPLGTLKARLHRAREKLRDRLIRAGVAP